MGKHEERDGIGSSNSREAAYRTNAEMEGRQGLPRRKEEGTVEEDTDDNGGN